MGKRSKLKRRVDACQGGQTLLIWTESYNPFQLGGYVHGPVGIHVKVGQRLPLGKGYYGYLVVNPLNGETHVAEELTGALIGPSLASVRKDVAAGDGRTMKNQIDAALARKAGVVVVQDEEDFWQRLQPTVVDESEEE